MNKPILVVILAAILSMAASVASANRFDEIAGRIQKVGSVCVEGQDCGAAATSTASAAASGSADVEASYNKTCATCHIAGIAGAPKLGDLEAWSPRLEKGIDALYQSAINGMPPAMPPKGTCFSCSDDDLKALVDYMVETVQ